MTIQLLQTWNGNPAGIYTWDSGEETRLINLGLARAWVPAIDGASGRGGSVVPISAATFVAPTAAMLADTRTFYELQTTKALYRSNGTSLELVGQGVGSSGIATSSGYDVTSAQATGGVLDWYYAGVKTVITRGGGGLPATQYLAALPALESTLTQVPGTSLYVVSAGPKWVGGALTMTTAQSNSLEAAILAGPETMELGFRVLCTDAGAYVSPAGVTTVTGWEKVWCGFGFIWAQGGVRYVSERRDVHTNSASESADLSALVIGAGVAGKRATVSSFAAFDFSTNGTVWQSAGSTSTKDCRIFLNGNALFDNANTAAYAANIKFVNVKKSFWHTDAVNAQNFSPWAQIDTSASNNGTMRSLAIDHAVTAFTVACRVHFAAASAADFARVRKHVVIVSDTDGLY
jgi:hypothetical protein